MSARYEEDSGILFNPVCGAERHTPFREPFQSDLIKKTGSPASYTELAYIWGITGQIWSLDLCQC